MTVLEKVDTIVLSERFIQDNIKLAQNLVTR